MKVIEEYSLLNGEDKLLFEEVVIAVMKVHAINGPCKAKVGRIDNRTNIIIDHVMDDYVFGYSSDRGFYIVDYSNDVWLYSNSVVALAKEDGCGDWIFITKLYE